MFLKLRSLVVLVSISVGCSVVSAQKAAEITPPKSYRAPSLLESPALKSIVEKAVADTRAARPGLKDTEIAVTLIDLREPNHLLPDPTSLRWANYRGEERIYPASVVKLFYLAALERQLEDKKVADTTELERGEKDMIVVSSNEATQYILDVLTGTSSGAELPKKDFEKWQFKRNVVNRFFTLMGYANINANQKTFCEDAYGIEQQSRNYQGQNRNALTTNAVARLLAEIVRGHMATPESRTKMMALLKRDPFTPNKEADDQAHGFTGKMLIERKMTDARLWSKAGWTSKARHDAAYIETSDGLKFVLVVFTENHATETDIIPAIAGRVLDGLRQNR